MGLKELRQGLNDKVREYGNIFSFNLGDDINKVNLGDVLTSEINFRKAGVFAGALLFPLALKYGFQSIFGEIPNGDYVLSPQTAMKAAMCGCAFTGSLLGYIGGEKLDSLVGNESERGL